MVDPSAVGGSAGFDFVVGGDGTASLAAGWNGIGIGGLGFLSPSPTHISNSPVPSTISKHCLQR